MTAANTTKQTINPSDMSMDSVPQHHHEEKEDKNWLDQQQLPIPIPTPPKAPTKECQTETLDNNNDSDEMQTRQTPNTTRATVNPGRSSTTTTTTTTRTTHHQHNMEQVPPYQHSQFVQPTMLARAEQPLSLPGAFCMYPGGRRRRPRIFSHESSNSNSSHDDTDSELGQDLEHGPMENHGYFSPQLEEEEMVVALAELADTLDQQERDRIREQVRQAMALECVKAEPVPTSPSNNQLNYCGFGQRRRQILWMGLTAAIAAIVTIVLVAALVIPERSSGDSSATTMVGSSGENVVGGDSVIEKDNAKTETTDMVGRKEVTPSSSVVLTLVELKDTNLYANKTTQESLTIDHQNILGDEDFEQLFQWTGRVLLEGESDQLFCFRRDTSISRFIGT